MPREITYELDELRLASGVLVWGRATIAFDGYGEEWWVTDIDTGSQHDGWSSIEPSSPLFLLIEDALERRQGAFVAEAIAEALADEGIRVLSEFEEHGTY